MVWTKARVVVAVPLSDEWGNFFWAPQFVPLRHAISGVTPHQPPSVCPRSFLRDVICAPCLIRVRAADLWLSLGLGPFFDLGRAILRPLGPGAMAENDSPTNEATGRLNAGAPSWADGPVTVRVAKSGEHVVRSFCTLLGRQFIGCFGESTQEVRNGLSCQG